MNKVILMGRLTRDPEVRYSQGENATAIARYNLAVDRRFKREGDTQTADFINCISFGKAAEIIEKYVHKGTKLIIEGRIQTGNYTNKEGQKVYGFQIIANSIEFAESKNASQSFGGDMGSNVPASEPTSNVGDDFMNNPGGIEEDLPFN